MKPGSKLNLVSLTLIAVLMVQFGATRQMARTNVVPASSARAKQNGIAQLPLPTRVGQVFLLDDFANKVTVNDLGFNYFAGNGGALGSGTATWVSASDGTGDGSLRLSYNFNTSPPDQRFAGAFFSVFGLTDTLVSLDGSGQEPAASTKFPGYYLDTKDVFRGFQPWANRSLEQLRFDARLESSSPITIKIELKDENERVVFTQRTISASSFQPFALNLPGDFTQGNTGSFDFRQVSVLSYVIDQANNPSSGSFLLDNLAFVDLDGQYPNLDAVRNDPQYAEAMLDYARATSILYFLDFASTDSRTGGMAQDRSTFADLMSVGAAGFQLTALCIAAERGYITKDNAANRVQRLLKVLHDAPQGAQRVGTTGYQGFFYHFLGIDGRRKQNFDFNATPQINEAKNTVELSVIDTALAICGVITARQYFSGCSTGETEIRQLADAIYARVNWRFMLDQTTNQFILGWKPNEMRDDLSGRNGRFLLNDAEGLGQYASKSVNGQEKAATLDFYTDEGLLIALLAIGSPNPAYRVGPSVFFSMVREGTPFVKTFPGSLFTYQFASCWLDTKNLGADRDPTGAAIPINYFTNTRMATLACQQYGALNPGQRASLSASRWGLNACEGPFDEYFAEAAPPLAHATGGECSSGMQRPLDVGTLTVYGAGSSIVHTPDEAITALWECQRLGLFHPRFGAADAFNLNIADAAVCVASGNPNVLRTTGEWRNFNGFGIDHGPMAILIDNYLSGQSMPNLFMSYPPIRAALNTLFPNHTLPRFIPARCPINRPSEGRRIATSSQSAR
jgi:hypothetical protein